MFFFSSCGFSTGRGLSAVVAGVCDKLDERHKHLAREAQRHEDSPPLAHASTGKLICFPKLPFGLQNSIHLCAKCRLLDPSTAPTAPILHPIE